MPVERAQCLAMASSQGGSGHPGGLDILGKPRGAPEAGFLVSSEAGPPLAGGSQKVKQPEILGCSRPRENWGRKKERKEMFRPGGEMSLLVSRLGSEGTSTLVRHGS